MKPGDGELATLLDDLKPGPTARLGCWLWAGGREGDLPAGGWAEVLDAAWSGRGPSPGLLLRELLLDLPGLPAFLDRARDLAETLFPAGLEAAAVLARALEAQYGRADPETPSGPLLALAGALPPEPPPSPPHVPGDLLFACLAAGLDRCLDMPARREVEIRLAAFTAVSEPRGLDVTTAMERVLAPVCDAAARDGDRDTKFHHGARTLGRLLDRQDACQRPREVIQAAADWYRSAKNEAPGRPRAAAFMVARLARTLKQIHTHEIRSGPPAAAHLLRTALWATRGACRRRS